MLRPPLSWQRIHTAFNPDAHPSVLDGVATRDEMGKQATADPCGPLTLPSYISTADPSGCFLPTHQWLLDPQFMEIFDDSLAGGVTLSDFEAAFSEISAVRAPPA